MSEQEVATPKAISVYDVIMAMVDQMSALAWQKMGLQPDMMTGKIVIDMDEAKVAVDLVAHLGSFIEPQLDENDKREIHNLVRNLRLNYVQKQKDATETADGSA